MEQQTTIEEAGGEAAPSPASKYDRLTTKERQVILRIAVGDDRVAIAKDMGISPKTFDTHRQHGMKKLGLTSNVELARDALRAGVVSL